MRTKLMKCVVSWIRYVILSLVKKWTVSRYSQMMKWIYLRLKSSIKSYWEAISSQLPTAVAVWLHALTMTLGRDICMASFQFQKTGMQNTDFVKSE